MNALTGIAQFTLVRLQQYLSRAGRLNKQSGPHRLAKHLIPNVGTLVILCMFLLAQSAGARPPIAPLAQVGTSILVSYQGTLTDQDGNAIEGNVNMNFALYHQAEGGTSFWTESYTGAQAVQVINGQFHVLLGSRTPLDPADLVGDLYLGITVNGEDMLPREPIVASTISRLIVSSGGTSMIAGNLQVGDNTWIPQFAGMDGNDMAVNGQFEQRGSGGARVYKLGIGTDPAAGRGTLAMGGGIDMNGHSVTDSGALDFRGHFHINVPADRHGGFWDMKNNNYILAVGSDSQQIRASRTLNMQGNSIINCGALTEANLQTPEELTAERIDRFEEGDVLCWISGRLEKCSRAGDRLVQAVADKEGRPIIIGAEAIKVLGPVQAGDILVASDVLGYAVVNSDPHPGTVIAQALEDFVGERGLVKAMIRKW